MADKKRRETKYSGTRKASPIPATPVIPRGKSIECDVAVIGAGAAGLASAVSGSEANEKARILVIDRNDIAGRKIRATGNGRCNISNLNADGTEDVQEFLAGSGIVVKCIGESGLMYPVSESANDVADALYDRALSYGCRFLMGAEVMAVSESEGRFTIKGRQGTDRFDVNAGRVILAAGGKAGPVYGTTGDAYKWVRGLGHTVVSPIPVLAPVECGNDDFSRLAGIRAKSLVTVRKNGKPVYEAEGEVQFTKFGLSGICIFNATRHMRYDRNEGISVYSVSLNLMPGEDTLEIISDRVDAEKKIASERTAYTSMPASTLLRTIVKDKLAGFILDRAGVDAGKPVISMNESDIAAISKELSELTFKPTGIRGWKEAQCTAGGVMLTEVNADTCESALVPGLYITGELLDYDGPCGGYNLNNAFLTGMNAGRAAVRGY